MLNKLRIALAADNAVAAAFGTTCNWTVPELNTHQIVDDEGRFLGGHMNVRTGEMTFTFGAYGLSYRWSRWTAEAMAEIHGGRVVTARPIK